MIVRERTQDRGSDCEDAEPLIGGRKRSYAVEEEEESGEETTDSSSDEDQEASRFEDDRSNEGGAECVPVNKRDAPIPIQVDFSREEEEESSEDEWPEEYRRGELGAQTARMDVEMQREDEETLQRNIRSPPMDAVRGVLAEEGESELPFGTMTALTSVTTADSVTTRLAPENLPQQSFRGGQGELTDVLTSDSYKRRRVS